MRLSQAFLPNMVWASLISKNKGEVISELSFKIADGLPNLKEQEIAAALLGRENLGSTGIEDGVAIPHAKIAALDKVVVACGRSSSGINFDASDQKPTHLFFVLLAPEHSAAAHLKVLARLSRLLKDKGFRDHLLRAKDEKDLYRIIIEEDARV